MFSRGQSTGTSPELSPSLQASAPHQLPLRPVARCFARLGGSGRSGCFAPRQREGVWSLRMVSRAAGPIHDGSPVESCFEPGALRPEAETLPLSHRDPFVQVNYNKKSRGESFRWKSFLLFLFTRRKEQNVTTLHIKK
ncbi:hypothetical protein AVEN_73293-1 [Araneus ventricosus]|uniref:Uncharacterized protein n=1 Tax=Araneus ventricosus TaxID=182803 RepID=A0A4Y2KJ95_ARAVE|nr:hypothetical protein AVEN_73293-1 [Araneus ventricosus]